jgi:flagellar assembly protein FliH
MSSRARRVPTATSIAPFAWGTRPAASVAPALPEPVPPPAAPEPDPVEAQASLAALERDAFMKGFAQGERAGAEAAAQRGEAMLRRLTETLEALTALRAQMIRQTERQMVQLALAVARRVINREVSLAPDLLIAMARVALDRLGESMAVTVRLHPEEFEATGAARAAQLEGSNVTVVADARVGRGGCRVESDLGAIEVGVDAQIQELALALLGDTEPVAAAVAQPVASMPTPVGTTG